MLYYVLFLWVADICKYVSPVIGGSTPSWCSLFLIGIGWRMRSPITRWKDGEPQAANSALGCAGVLRVHDIRFVFGCHVCDPSHTSRFPRCLDGAYFLIGLDAEQLARRHCHASLKLTTERPHPPRRHWKTRRKPKDQMISSFSNKHMSKTFAILRKKSVQHERLFIIVKPYTGFYTQAGVYICYMYDHTLWQQRPGDLWKTRPLPHQVAKLPDGRWIAGGVDGTIYLGPGTCVTFWVGSMWSFAICLTCFFTMHGLSHVVFLSDVFNFCFECECLFDICFPIWFFFQCW